MPREGKITAIQQAYAVCYIAASGLRATAPSFLLFMFPSGTPFSMTKSVSANLPHGSNYAEATLPPQVYFIPLADINSRRRLKVSSLISCSILQASSSAVFGFTPMLSKKHVSTLWLV